MNKGIAEALENSAARLPKTKGRKTSISFGDEIRALRESLDLSQEAFCQKYDIPIANLRNWEQPGRQVVPDSAARLLVAMIQVDPDRVAILVDQARKKRNAMKP